MPNDEKLGATTVQGAVESFTLFACPAARQVGGEAGYVSLLTPRAVLLSADDVRKQIDLVVSSWANPPKGGVEVLQSGYDLPDSIQSDLSMQGILEDVEGFFLPSQEKVYLLVDNVRCSVDRPLRLLFHEVYGHRGLRALLGRTARATTLYRLQRANPKLAQEALAWYASHGESDIKHRIRNGATESDARQQVTLMAIEEALADRAAQLPKVSPALRRRAICQWRLRMSGNDALADRMEEIWEAETSMLLAGARAITVAGAPTAIQQRVGPGRRAPRNEAARPELRTGGHRKRCCYPSQPSCKTYGRPGKG